MASYDKAIPPGGEGKITLRVDTSGYQGRIRKNALVRSNDPGHPRVEISVSLNVRPHILVEPCRRLVLGGIVGEDIRRQLRIEPNDGYPLEILGVETDLPEWVGWKLLPQAADDKYQLEVYYRGRGKALGAGNLRLLTNHPREKELRLRVYVRVRPEFEVWPAEVVFGRVPATVRRGETVKRLLAVSNNRARGFRLGELLYNKRYFAVKVARTSGNPPWRYWLEVIPHLQRLPAGTTRDTLVIRPEARAGLELQVPLTIEVERPSN